MVLHLTNYQYFIPNHNEQIPIINRIIDLSYLKNDWFVNQNDGFSARYFYSAAIAYLTNFFDLPIVYFIVF